MNAITSKQITKLENEIKAKDAQINSLKLLEGKLQGKDETIAKLNDLLSQLKVDAKIEHSDDNHQHVDLLKKTIDELTAKNIELEALT